MEKTFKISDNWRVRIEHVGFTAPPLDWYGRQIYSATFYLDNVPFDRFEVQGSMGGRNVHPDLKDIARSACSFAMEEEKFKDESFGNEMQFVSDSSMEYALEEFAPVI